MAADSPSSGGGEARGAADSASCCRGNEMLPREKEKEYTPDLEVKETFANKFLCWNVTPANAKTYKTVC